MALRVGDLVATLFVDRSQFDSALDQAGERFSGMGDKLRTAALAAGALAGVALVSGIVGAMNESDIGAKVAASIGDVGPDAVARYGALAGEIYADNFGDSVASVGDALSVIAKSEFVDPANNEQLKALTEQSMILSDVWGLDVTDSFRAAQQMVRTGVVGSLTEANDLIAAAATSGLDLSGDLTDTMNEYAIQWKKVGIDGQTAMGLISQAVKGGARDTDVAADAIKEFSVKAIDGSKASRDAYRALGLDASTMMSRLAAGGDTAKNAFQLVLDKVKGISDPVAQNAVAVGLFGTKAEDLGGALAAMDLRTAAASLGEISGAATRAGETMQLGFGAKVELVKRQLEQKLVNFLNTKGVQALKQFGDALKAIGDWAQSNAGILGSIGVFIAAIAGPILTVIAAMRIWTAVTAAYTAVQAALNVVMAMNPIFLVIIAVVALVAALIYAYQNCEKFREGVQTVFNAVKVAALWLWDALKAIWSGLVTGVMWVVDKFKAYFSFVISSWRAVGNAASSIFGSIADIIGGAFSRAAGMVKSGVNFIIGAVNGAINRINSLTGVASSIGVHIPHIPQIPRLARGGTVKPTTGGRPVIMGDGGEVEYGMPESKLQRLVDIAVSRGAGGDGATGGTKVVELRGTGSLGGFKRRIRLDVNSRNVVELANVGMF